MCWGRSRRPSGWPGAMGPFETDARIAALLHDCSKKLDMEQQLALCRRYDIR